VKGAWSKRSISQVSELGMVANSFTMCSGTSDCWNWMGPPSEHQAALM
jgi:hypothetical protein